jgi:ribosomal protein S18 acetylase RimI-like enzyme
MNPVYNYCVSAQVLTGFIRPVDPRRDLFAIADLIELCFADQMDDDGRDYLRHIRRAGREPGLQRWMPGANERVSSPLFGFVWEENGQIIGNLTLIPFFRDGIWRYLVANVATHPNFRGRGIGRQLTQSAIDHVRNQGASAIWLQVRDDNPVAHHLYEDLGFLERARRTTWELTNPTPDPPPLDRFKITRRTDSDWRLQEKWLRLVYPTEVAWNLNFQLGRYTPSLLNGLVHFLNNEHIEQWSIYRGSDLLGVAVWDAAGYISDSVWVAPNPACEDQALSALLSVLRREVVTPRSLTLNYPAGQGENAFMQTGFTLHNTLIWMSTDLT